MKKLINAVDDIVPESLSGLEAAHADIVKIDLSQMLVLRAGGPKAGKVALVSGGGSGHEPLHGGFVGLGMLDAAAAGHIFTSPVPDQMEAATRAVDGGAGVLHIVKNYTGDILNFQMAAELVAGDIEVATVVTNDDVAVEDSLYTAGRRGVGVTVLVEKIAGAQAEAGATLADVAATANKVNKQGKSMGLALTSCIVPAAGTPSFDLPDDEVEVGIGIHGEPGRRREKLAPVDDMAEWLLTPIVSDLGLSRGDNVLAFVNGMGGTPLIELYI
ncbi:MAG: dihydroxyacetone kinase subunit DhaK, partial [Candidatus Limnocylindrales bacterium]